MEVKINELMAIAAAADLTTDNGAATLETALLEDFRARDLHVYFDFAYQYNATSDQKRRHDKLIQRLRDTYAKYIDRAADLGIDGATKHGDFIEVDAPDGSELCPTLLDRPLGSIIREVKRKEKQLFGMVKDIAKNGTRRGDFKEGRRYIKTKQRGIDERAPLKKEINERLGITTPTRIALLKNPDNEWGLTTDCIQSWQAFTYYCETHKDIIDQHKVNAKSKIRKPRAKLVLTKTGNMSDLSQSATQNFKPHGRTIAKPKR